jgi:hypothetical protein
LRQALEQSDQALEKANSAWHDERQKYSAQWQANFSSSPSIQAQTVQIL